MGQGIAVLGFWLFLAIVFAGSVWKKVAMRRDAMDMVRQAIDKGQPLDEKTVQALLGEEPHQKTSHKNDDQTAADVFLIFGSIAFAVGIGFAIRAWYVIVIEEDASPLPGFAIVIGLVSVALLFLHFFFARRVRKSLARENSESLERPDRL